MQSLIHLSELPCGHTAVISAVHGTGAMHERLHDLGFTEDSEVSCVFPSAFGDPRAYQIRGTVIGLRASDAHHILCLYGGNV